MVKFPEAAARIQKNIFVCKDCKGKVRAPNMSVIRGKVSCRSCGSRALRVARKK